MTEEFHRTRPKIFRFAVTKAPPERVAIKSTVPSFVVVVVVVVVWGVRSTNQVSAREDHH
jgi:hypothetical protein